MKLLHLSPVLCAFLVACGSDETASNSTTSPDADAAPTMKTVSFTGDHGASTANDPKTGTVNPFGGKADSGPTPSTRIVERTGIDPKTKTIKIGGKTTDDKGGKTEKLTADGVNPSSTPGTRKVSETGKVKTGTVNPFAGKDSKGKTEKLTADGVNPSSTPGTRKVSETGKVKTGTVNPFVGKDSKGKTEKLTADGVDPSSTPGTRKVSETGKVKTGTVKIGEKTDGKTEGKPAKDTDSKGKPDTKEKPSKDKPSKDKSGN